MTKKPVTLFLIVCVLLSVSLTTETYEEEDVTLTSGKYEDYEFSNCSVTVESASLRDITFEGGTVETSSQSSKNVIFKDVNLTSTSGSHQDCEMENVNASYSSVSVINSNFTDSNVTLNRGQINQNSIIDDTEIRVCEGQITKSSIYGGTVFVYKGQLTNLEIEDSVIILENANLVGSTVRGSTVCLRDGANENNNDFYDDSSDSSDSSDDDPCDFWSEVTFCGSLGEWSDDDGSDSSDDEDLVLEITVRYEIDLDYFEDNGLIIEFEALIEGLFEYQVDVEIKEITEGSTIIKADIHTQSMESEGAIQVITSAQNNQNMAVDGVEPASVEYRRLGDTDSAQILKFNGVISLLVFLLGIIFMAE